MKSFKGFNRNEDSTLSCRDFTYKVGETYKYDGEISLCESGFHACHELHQCWTFYPNNGNNVFCEVECGGNIINSNNGDGKFVCSEITILREVDMSGVEAFNGAWDFRDGYARIEKYDKYNHISTDGKLLSDEWWDGAWGFRDGYAMVRNGNKYNHIGTDGKLLSKKWWDNVCSFQEGYAWVKRDGKYNHIGTDGKLLSEEWWDDAWYFHDGYARVRKGDKYNHIGTDGKLLSEEWWDDAWSFSDGYAWVRKDGKEYKIDTKGKVPEC